MRVHLQRLIVTAIVMAAMLGAARAADGNGQFAIKGLGLSDCATLLRARKEKSNDYKIFLIWIDGYVTGRNELTDGTFDLLSWESPDLIAQIASQFCTDHPQARIAGVIRQIVNELSDQRLTGAAKLVAVRHGDQAFLVYADTLLRAKSALSERGFYDGPKEPVFDKALEDALGAFQKQEGLQQTFLPDQVTLWKLLRSDRK